MLDAQADARGGEGSGADASDWPPLPLECGGLRRARAAVCGATGCSSFAVTEARSDSVDDSQTGEWTVTAACEGWDAGGVSHRSLASGCAAGVGSSAAACGSSLHIA